MDIPPELHCLFSATLEEEDGTAVVEIPEEEIHRGELQDGETYRVALLSSPTSSETKQPTIEPTSDPTPPEPPVDEGETRSVEIDTIGDQGDGLARVERGFVVIVPDTKQGDHVAIEITDVRENVAFAQVVERLDEDAETA